MAKGVWTFAGLLLLCTAVVADEAEAKKAEKCSQCKQVLKMDKAVFWGPKIFCSDACKDKFWQASQDRQWRCKTCDKKVKGISGDAKKNWDGLCPECRAKAQAPAGVQASSLVEMPAAKGKTAPAPVPSVRANKYRTRPAKPVPVPYVPPDQGISIPLLTKLLGAVFAVLIGVRFYFAKKQPAPVESAESLD